MAVSVNEAFAERIADIGRVLTDHEGIDSDAALRQLTALGVELVPAAVAAAVTISGDDSVWTFAVSDQRVDELHRLQFESGDGPVAETVRYNEPRRIDDMAAEQRWPAFCRAAARAGFTCCLSLPLRTDRQPSGAVSLYGDQPCGFQGASHDIALLFAAQGGTALYNASVYRACRTMVDNLQRALESRAVIEQAKGVLRAELGVSPEEAFRLISKVSQRTNTKVRQLAADLVQGRVPADQFLLPGFARHDGDGRDGSSGPDCSPLSPVRAN